MKLFCATGVEAGMKLLSTLCIATALITGLCGCTRKTATEQPAPLQKPPLATDDQVIDFVLNDLLSVGGSPLGTGKEKNPPATISFETTPSKYPRDVAAVLMKHDKKQWEKLSAAQLELAQEAATDLVARWQRKEIDPPFAPSDARVKVYQPPTTKSVGDIYNRPVLAWRPGFTADRQFAVVSLSIPWSMHHADATYLLEQQNGVWKIILRQFVYYV